MNYEFSFYPFKNVKTLKIWDRRLQKKINKNNKNDFVFIMYFKSILHFRVPPTISFNCCYTFVLFSIHWIYVFTWWVPSPTHNLNLNKMASSRWMCSICSIDLYNRDLHTTITLFTFNISSHNIVWILTELIFPVPSWFWYCMFDECPWSRISISSKQVVYVIVIFVFYLGLSFYTDVVAIFRFIRWSCKQYVD